MTLLRLNKITTDMKQTILKRWRGKWPIIRSSEPLPLGEGVIDQATFSTIEMDKLFDKLNFAGTIVGQSTLFRSLTQPLTERDAIIDKQEAIREIQDEPGVRDNLEQIVQRCAAREKHLYRLLFGEFLSTFGTAREEYQVEGYGYKQYRRGVRFVLDLVGFIHASGSPRSRYLRNLFERILAFGASRTYSMMLGPVYNSEKGFQSKEERKGSFTPATIFRPNIFKPLLILAIIAVIWSVMVFFPTDMFRFSTSAIPVAAIFFIPMLLVYFPVVGTYDRDHCIIPLRDQFRECNELADALDALGELDELLALIKYAEHYGGSMVLPEMIDGDSHSIELTEARNPLLGFGKPDYVANSFAMTSEKLVFITGPNSGGKTAFCKTVTQIQILAQIGSYVPAEKARLTVADRVFYQAPALSQLDDGEGRFGTELKRTKDIFLATGPRSLVVLDEMAEGTTFEEKMESSANVLDGFYRKGNDTILITHNHQLVEMLIKQGIGAAKQVEFARDHPTYRLIDGISRVSHADRVARKIGFSKKDIDNFLAGSS